MYYRVGSLSEIYLKVGLDLLSKGEVVNARSKETKELRSVNIELTDPTKNLMLLPGRKFNLAFALVESLMLFDIAEDSDNVHYYSYFNSNIAQFSDDGLRLRGAYSKQVAGNLRGIIRKLKEDKDTRQAVIQIYSNEYIGSTTKDTPCTMDLQFMIRNNKLELHAYMRSNDIIWGLPYDIFNFTNLQMVIANTLGIEVGSYYHNVTSMHVYDNHYELLSDITSKLSIEKVKNVEEEVVPTSIVSYSNKRDIVQQFELLVHYKYEIVAQRSMSLACQNLTSKTMSDEQAILAIEQLKKYLKNGNSIKDDLQSYASIMIHNEKLRALVLERWRK